ncbi:hypothetical protein [Singulisphaera sp. PoT]|uniref:hypothetical protein n=1 Tax=Singulisphaera sp. PoT TaxID=3411797 RepID=UPI003BF514C4
MRPVAFRRLLRRNRTVLAVYMLAGDRGMVCNARNIEIGRAAGLSPELTREALEGLVRDKVITILGPRDGISCRFIVLMDHPEADAFVAEVREIYGPHSPRARGE